MGSLELVTELFVKKDSEAASRAVCVLLTILILQLGSMSKINGSGN